MALSHMSGKTLKKRWKLGRLLGHGACAEVFEVEDLAPSKFDKGAQVPLVAKVCSLPQKATQNNNKKKKKRSEQEKLADTVYYEYVCYNGGLRDHPSVPFVPFGGYGEDEGVRYLIMERLGSDLTQRFEADGKSWGVDSVRDYGIQALEALRVLHQDHKTVFVDVKPENFMLGLPGSEKAGQVHLIDFGLCERWVSAGGKHKELRTGGAPNGTPEYLSLSCHQGSSGGRSDDIEALGYILASWLRGGNLPWSDAKSASESLAVKRKASVENICGEWSTLAQFIKLARDTPFDAEPEYKVFQQLLQKMKGAAKPRRRAGAAAAEGGAKEEGVPKKGRTRRAATAKGAPEAAGGGKPIPSEEAAPTRMRRQRVPVLASDASDSEVGSGAEVVGFLLTASPPGRRKKHELEVRWDMGEVLLGRGSAHLGLKSDAETSLEHLAVEAIRIPCAERKRKRGSSVGKKPPTKSPPPPPALRVTDKGSENGSTVNGQPVIPKRRVLVHDGDVIQVGQTVIKVSLLRE